MLVLRKQAKPHQTDPERTPAIAKEERYMHTPSAPSHQTFSFRKCLCYKTETKRLSRVTNQVSILGYHLPSTPHVSRDHISLFRSAILFLLPQNNCNLQGLITTYFFFPSTSSPFSSSDAPFPPPPPPSPTTIAKTAGSQPYSKDLGFLATPSPD